jgi:hypothetical protein
MQWPAALPDSLDDSWGYALVFGALSIPPTVLWSDFAANSMNATAVLLAGILAGATYGGGVADGRAVGLRVGVVGTVPALAIYADMAAELWTAATAPGVSTARLVFVAVIGPGVMLFLAAVTVFVGLVGGLIGVRISERVDFLPRRTVPQ